WCSGLTAIARRSRLTVGHDPGIHLIAEGIEQQEQYEILRAQGCGLFQGYLFGKPMQAEAFEEMAEARPATSPGDG
ncbi:MAG: EAL domain-containing protein, partial [Pseudoxanthomonas sp.]